MKKERLIQRYKRAERFNHWVVAGCFVLLAISGLAFFYPAFFWLTGIFGTHGASDYRRGDVSRLFPPIFALLAAQLHQQGRHQMDDGGAASAQRA